MSDNQPTAADAAGDMAAVPGPHVVLHPFVDGWTFDDGSGHRAVVLPHDAMLASRRSADAPARYHGAWFHGGRYEYRKVWTVDASLRGGRAELLFEGLQGDTRVLVDGVAVGSIRNGYDELVVDLTPFAQDPGQIEIVVAVDSTDLPNGRWYSGSGIYRPVWLRTSGDTRFTRDGIVVRTTSLAEGLAQLAVDVEVEGPLTDGLRVEIGIHLPGSDEAVASHSVDVAAARTSFPLELSHPRLWSDEDPSMYRAHVRLRDHDGRVLDDSELGVGVRLIDFGPEGMTVNGRRTILRGGNVHHDNGIVGAAGHRAAEFRRARILKASGYNAIRSAHNPISRDLLDACDAHGLFVMDELTDVWWQSKTHGDGAEDFLDAWPDRLRRMVRKDRSHPSVIMYSIGNENGETGWASGIRLAQQMRDLVRAEDTSRPVTAGINLGLTSSAYRADQRRKKDASHTGSGAHPPLDSTVFNILFAALQPLVDRMVTSPKVDEGTVPIFGVLDVAGYNYGVPRYEQDLKNHPGRLIVGTETRPHEVATVAPMAARHPRLLGDFTWASWDHLGEAGIGVWLYGRLGSLMKPYPYLLSGAGAIDITGLPGAPAMLAQAAWGRDDAPLIAVRPVPVTGKRAARTPWRNSDAVPSWSWEGYEAHRAEVEVYSSAEEIELILNGRAIGRRPAGEGNRFVARFHTRYFPGRLTAVAYRGGAEIARTILESAGPTSLQLREEDALGDAAFVVVERADELGVATWTQDVLVHLTLDGPAELLGFGSAAPATRESFVDHHHYTWRGRALALVKRTAPGPPIVVNATSPAGEYSLELSI